MDARCAAQAATGRVSWSSSWAQQDAKPSAAVELSPLLKERPAAAEAKAWCEENLPKLPADQRAIIMGLTPRGALNYDASPAPAALVVDPATGTTAVMVAQRDATRLRVTVQCDAPSMRGAPRRNVASRRNVTPLRVVIS